MSSLDDYLNVFVVVCFSAMGKHHYTVCKVCGRSLRRKNLRQHMMETHFKGISSMPLDQKSYSITTEELRANVNQAVDKIHIATLQGVPFGVLDSMLKAASPGLNTIARHSVIMTIRRVAETTRSIFSDVAKDLPQLGDTYIAGNVSSCSSCSSSDGGGQEREERTREEEVPMSLPELSELPGPLLETETEPQAAATEALSEPGVTEPLTGPGGGPSQALPVTAAIATVTAPASGGASIGRKVTKMTLEQYKSRTTPPRESRRQPTPLRERSRSRDTSRSWSVCDPWRTPPPEGCSRGRRFSRAFNRRSRGGRYPQSQRERFSREREQMQAQMRCMEQKIRQLESSRQEDRKRR